MTTDLAGDIERFLFERAGWVRAAEICERFELNERALRSDGKRPGLCTEFAISGDKGFRHLTHATDTEFQRAFARMRTHGLAELVHARRLRRARERALTARATRPYTVERATGQGLLLPPESLPA